MKPPVTTTAEALGERELGPVLLHEFLRQLAGASRELQAADASRHHAVHEARRALKRARAALCLLRRSAPKMFKAADRETRNIARLLSRFRDQDVVVALLDALLAEPVDGELSSETRAVLWYLYSREERGHRELQQSFDAIAGQFEERRRAIAAKLDDRAPPALAVETALLGVADQLATTRQRFQEARICDDPDAFHRCRKGAQRSLNQVLLLRGLQIDVPGANLHALQSLAHTLGRLQDLYVLEQRLGVPERDKLLRAGARQLRRRLSAEQRACKGEAEKLISQIAAARAPRDVADEPR